MLVCHCNYVAILYRFLGIFAYYQNLKRLLDQQYTHIGVIYCAYAIEQLYSP